MSDEPVEVLVESIFPVPGRGIIAVGSVMSGNMIAGQDVWVVRPDGRALATIVRGIEMTPFRAHRPDRISFLLGEEADDFLTAGTLVRDRMPE